MEAERLAYENSINQLTSKIKELETLLKNKIIENEELKKMSMENAKNRFQSTGFSYDSKIYEKDSNSEIIVIFFKNLKNFNIFNNFNK